MTGAAVVLLAGLSSGCLVEIDGWPIPAPPSTRRGARPRASRAARARPVRSTCSSTSHDDRSSSGSACPCGSPARSPATRRETSTWTSARAARTETVERHVRAGGPREGGPGHPRRGGGGRRRPGARLATVAAWWRHGPMSREWKGRPSPAPTGTSWHRLAAGDREALAPLMERHYRRLYRIALSYLRNPDDALDACRRRS